MASVLARQKLVVAPNPLAYPAGVAAGFDPNHIASPKQSGAAGMLSAVAAGSNFVEITTGIPATVVGTTTAANLGILGPSVARGAGAGCHFPSKPTAIGNKYTLGGIFQATSFGTTAFIVGNSLSGTGGVELRLSSGVLALNVNGGTNTSSGFPACLINTPYFAAVTVNGVASSFVLVNLATGQIWSATVTGVSSPGVTGSGTWAIFDTPSGTNQIVGYVAAAMVTLEHIGLAGLLQWAKDPWSFWYPRPAIQYTAPVVSTDGARIRRGWNQPRLVYPAGVAAGIDPSHPASANLLISTVASGGNHRDLTTGKLGTIVSGPARKIDGNIGESVDFQGVTDRINFSSFPTTAFSVGTTAAIYKFTSNLTNNPCDVCGDSNGSNVGLGIGRDNTSGFSVRWATSFQNAASNFSGLSATNPLPTLNVPYFVVASASAAAINLLIMRLDTGQIWAATDLLGFGSATGTGTYVVGGRDTTSGRQIGGPVACTMRSTTFLTLIQMRQWAADPWAFWYPNKTTINLTSAPASGGGGGSFLAAWASWLINLPVIGTGNY